MSKLQFQFMLKNLITNEKGLIYFPVVIVVLIIAVTGSFLIYGNSINTQIKNTAINFTQLLIEGKAQDAANLSAGSVKYNLATNQKSNGSYQYLNADAQIETANPKVAIVHVAASYKSDALNVSFYKLSMVKQDNSFKVFQVVEEDPTLLTDKTIFQDKPDSFISVYQSYLTGIEKQDYKKAGEVLIGKAKKSHDSTSQYLQKTKLVQNISDLKADVISSSQKQAAVTFSYTNDNRSISTIVYFYNTVEGWKIYDISQI